MESTAALDSLCAVRAAVPACWRYRAAALLTTGTAPAPAPCHRRGWGSLYAALTHGHMARQARRDLVIRHALTEGLPLQAVSVWLRCAAETSPERGFDYHAARHSAGPPSVAGCTYHWINPLSVDTTKKELVGDFKNGGHEGQPKGRPQQVRVHDFLQHAVGRATPYGVYDLGCNESWVNVGLDHDTATFAVESIRRWWPKGGRARYPTTRHLLITADGGWQQRLAPEAVEVRPSAPGG